MKNIILLLFIAIGIACFAYQNYVVDTSKEKENNTLSFDNQISTNQHKKTSNFILGGEQLPFDSVQEWTDTLKNVGMNSVVIKVKARQGIWDSDDLSFEVADTLSVLERIRVAQKADLNVLLLPQIWLDKSIEDNQLESLWEGMIFPQTEEAIDSWFRKYSTFILFWAKIAERENVHIMSIGSDLKALTSARIGTEKVPFLSREKNKTRVKSRKQSSAGFMDDLFEKNKVKALKKMSSIEPLSPLEKKKELLTQKWLQLIDDVRQIYTGKITYAAHHDNYTQIEFWTALDFLGINAHFSLSDRSMEAVDIPIFYGQLKSNWQAIFDELNDFKSEESLTEKEVLFTDIAYSCYENATQKTWEKQLSLHRLEALPKDIKHQTLAYDERMLAVDALVEVNKKHKNTLLKGVLYNSLTVNQSMPLSYPLSLQIGKASTDHLQNELLKFLEEY